MHDITEVTNAIDRLTAHPECIGWKDFGDAGNSCTGRLDRPGTPAQHRSYICTRAAVEYVVPKYSEKHIALARVVAKEMGVHYITYDNLIKRTARVLNGVPSQKFNAMIDLSLQVQAAMRKKGLSEITSIEDALA